MTCVCCGVAPFVAAVAAFFHNTGYLYSLFDLVLGRGDAHLETNAGAMSSARQTPIRAPSSPEA